VTLVSDKSLLIRVIGNMIKNALEPRSRDTISAGCYGQGTRSISGSIIRLHAGKYPAAGFNRSFSTKGAAGTRNLRHEISDRKISHGKDIV